MPTIRAYLDGQSPETAVSAEGLTTAVALRKAVKKLGLRPTSKTTMIEELSSRHRLIEWAGVRVHVLEESRAGSSGAPKRGRAVTAGGLRIDLVLDATEARCLEALMQPGETRTKRIAQLIVDAYEEQAPEPK